MKPNARSLLSVIFAFLILSMALTALSTLSIAYGQSATPTAIPLPHWTYEGAEGPDKWGKLDDRFAVCATGHAQSPIDLTKAQKLDLVDIKFNYKPSKLNIFNNGHTIQVNYDEGSSIIYNEIEYKLVQFHFHHPSEHTIDGKAFDMELHFVHQNASGDLAVVGVMIHKTDKDNPAYASIFDNLPTGQGTPQPTTTMVDAAKLLPAVRLYDTYVGSLTTPPCSEGVRWLVLTTPIDLSAKQIDAFAKLFEGNARPVQLINSRDLLQDNLAAK